MKVFWIILAVVILIAIVAAIYYYNKRKEEETKAALQAAQLAGITTSEIEFGGTSEFLGTLVGTAGAILLT